MKKDITGQKFGRLTAIKEVKTSWNKQKKEYVSFWLFKCDCGKYKAINKYSVINGRSKSCGCAIHDVLIKRNTTHNMTNTRLYRCWQDMKNRCYNPTRERYNSYGGRGIRVCDDWKNSFENFYNWAINNGYKDGLTIERIDVNLNYEPRNCTWITMREQYKNKRNTIFIEYKGERKYIGDWCKELGLNEKMVRSRYYRGYSVEDMFYKGNFNSSRKKI